MLLDMSYFFLILVMVSLDIFCSNPLKILVKTRNFKLKLGKNIKNTLRPIKHFQKYFMVQQSFYYLINKLLHKKMKTLSPSFSSAIPSLPKQNVLLDCFLFIYILWHCTKNLTFPLLGNNFYLTLPVYLVNITFS